MFGLNYPAYQQFILRFFEGEGAGGAGGPDGTGGTGAGGTSGGGGGTSSGGAPASGDASAGKTFTQEQVDRIAAERARRERAQFADYDDLKKKAEAFDAAEAEKKTAAEKEAEARAKRDKEAEAREVAANRRLIAAEIKMQAAGRVHNPDHVVSLLSSDPGIKVAKDGTTVEGVKEALDAFLADEANAYLVKKEGSGGTNRSGGEFNGRDSKTLQEQIAEAEAAKDWKKSSALKMQLLRTQQ